MAGMGETCNHVAAAMFRVESTVRTGLTNPSCKSSGMNDYRAEKILNPQELKI